MRRFIVPFLFFLLALFVAGCAGVNAPSDSALGGVVASSESGAGTIAAGKPAEKTDDGEADSTRGGGKDAVAPASMPAPAPLVSRESSKGISSAFAPSESRPVPSASGLKAGFSDDNAQFNYFLEFLRKYDDVEHFPYDISERITIKVVDALGKPVANAMVSISADGAVLVKGLTYSDGLYRFYPAALSGNASTYAVWIDYGVSSARADVARNGSRQVEVKLAKSRSVPSQLPLDILFVMDTTGSMGEEIERLKATMEIIYDNISALKPRPLVRFGLVLYKDRGDEYITQVVPFMDDLAEFQAALDPVIADGGGDGPEDLESALDDAINAMAWNKDGLRLAFVVTDAEAHLDYSRDYRYIDAANDARAKAIRMHTIGTGGLPLEAEYLLRQVSQLSDSKYIFLTYGESGEAEGGREGSVSHHTGSNFQTDKLEAIIIRFVKEDVSNLSDVPLAVDEDYFSATKVRDESRDETLDKLFAEAIGNLADYSTFRVGSDTPCVVLPVAVVAEDLGPTAEYFGERLVMASAGAKRWKPIERKDFQKILAELELQLSGLADENSAAKVGQLLGADVLVASTCYKRADQYELFLRLVRVSTAEVLAVSRAKIALDLGL